MTTETIDITPRHAGVCRHLLAIIARPDDCSDVMDVYVGCIDGEAEEQREAMEGLAESKRFAERHFMFLSQLVDCINDNIKEMPEAFKVDARPIIAEYKQA